MNVFELFGYTSNEEIIEAIKSLNDINVKGKKGRTLLHYACFYGGLKVIRYLVKQGADINAKDENGQTPLHFACFGNKLKLIKLLIKHGADAKEELKYWLNDEEISIVKTLTKAGACFL